MSQIWKVVRNDSGQLLSSSSPESSRLTYALDTTTEPDEENGFICCFSNVDSALQFAEKQINWLKKPKRNGGGRIIPPMIPSSMDVYEGIGKINQEFDEVWCYEVILVGSGVSRIKKFLKLSKCPESTVLVESVRLIKMIKSFT
jgi:hypothetical protein